MWPQGDGGRGPPHTAEIAGKIHKRSTPYSDTNSIYAFPLILALSVLPSDTNSISLVCHAASPLCSSATRIGLVLCLVS